MHHAALAQRPVQEGADDVPTALHLSRLGDEHVDRHWGRDGTPKAGHKLSTPLPVDLGKDDEDVEVGVRAILTSDGRTSPRSAPARVTVEAPRDTVRPTAPRRLVVTSHTSAAATTRTFVRATWQPATDNVGVTAYRVFRDGRLLAAVEEASGLVFVEDVTGLDARREHVYTVRAVDAAGNESAPSNEDFYPARVD